MSLYWFSYRNQWRLRDSNCRTSYLCSVNITYLPTIYLSNILYYISPTISEVWQLLWLLNVEITLYLDFFLLNFFFFWWDQWFDLEFSLLVVLLLILLPRLVCYFEFLMQFFSSLSNYGHNSSAGESDYHKENFYHLLLRRARNNDLYPLLVHETRKLRENDQISLFWLLSFKNRHYKIPFKFRRPRRNQYEKKRQGNFCNMLTPPHSNVSRRQGKTDDK